MASVKYLVPYEIAVKASDIKSGKPITNLLYVKTLLQSTGPPAYGGDIAGSGSTATLLAAVRVKWVTYFVPQISANYLTSEYVMRSIVGKAVKTPKLAVTSLIPGTPVTVSLTSPHGLATGQKVRLSGITAPAALNADWNVVVLDIYSFTLAGSSSATAWSGDGYGQALIGASGFEYGEAEVLTAADSGGISGDACPLFDTFSVRRLLTFSGKNFRSRLSLSPVAESSQVNGGLTSSIKTAWAAAIATLVAAPYALNGGTDIPGSGQSYFIGVSKQLALNQSSPFTQSNSWTSSVNNYQVRPNTGSLLRRKPKLTASIST